MNELLTKDETAEYLRISPGTLSYMRHVGNAPPALKVGKHVRWRKSDLDAWIEKQLAADADR